MALPDTDQTTLDATASYAPLSADAIATAADQDGTTALSALTRLESAGYTIRVNGLWIRTIDGDTQVPLG